MSICNNYLINNIIIFIKNKINLLIILSSHICQFKKLKKIKKNDIDDWYKYIIEKADNDAYNAYKNILKYDNDILWTDNLYIDRNYLINNLGEYYKEPDFNLKNKSKIYDDIADIYYKNFCDNIIYHYNNFDDI